MNKTQSMIMYDTIEQLYKLRAEALRPYGEENYPLVHAVDVAISALLRASLGRKDNGQ